MQSSIIWLVLTTVVYLSGSFTTVYARCSGRWAIHACYGGNGKRSSAAISPPEPRSPDRQFILRQLLLADRLPTIAEDTPVSPITDSDSLNEDYQDFSVDARLNELGWMQKILSNLLHEERLRSSKTNEMDFKR